MRNDKNNPLSAAEASGPDEGRMSKDQVARFEKAAALQKAGNASEALKEFQNLAEIVSDPLDRVGMLLNVVSALTHSGDGDGAKRQLVLVEGLISGLGQPSPEEERGREIKALEMGAKFEDVVICESSGDFEGALKKVDIFLSRYARQLRDPYHVNIYRMAQTRRGFLLADLGRWKEALPIFQEADSFTESRELLTFYLGHCYYCAAEYDLAVEKLSEAFQLRLPQYLEPQAHHELGMAAYRLGDYARAKYELERFAKTADAAYIARMNLWTWLQNACLRLGLKSEAQHYAMLARPS
jgi:tetratricopeptide (TPR) repeat protein